MPVQPLTSVQMDAETTRNDAASTGLAVTQLNEIDTSRTKPDWGTLPASELLQLFAFLAAFRGGFVCLRAVTRGARRSVFETIYQAWFRR